MSRLTALAMCIALVACDPPQRLVIDGAVPFPRPDCLADLDAPRLTGTLVDVTALTHGTFAVLAVDSVPPEPMLFPTDAYVWFPDAPPGLPNSRATARDSGPTYTVSGPQQPPYDGEDQIALVNLVTKEEAALLIDAPDGVLEANISVEGRHAEYTSRVFESEPLTLAIDLCHGCLVVACVDERPCVEGQDEPVGPPCPAP